MKNIYGLILRGPAKVEFSKNLEEHFNFVPQAGQLLIQVKYAPMNPSDFYFFKNVYYDKKPFPCIPGFEGFGVVAGAGDEANQHMIGKPCAFLAMGKDFGAYASHTVTSVKSTIILDAIPNPDTFEFLVNPITAIGLLDEAIKIKAKSFIQTGASTSVGKLILYLNQQGPKLDNINVVRDIKHRDELIKLGGGQVLSSTDSQFYPLLEKSIATYQPTAVFDCLSGRPSGEIFNRLPHNSVHLIYGILELKPVEGIDGSELIFTGKQLRGFHLFHSFLKYKDLGQFHKEVNDVAKNFTQAPGVKVFDVEHFEQAYKYFPNKKEKLLFRCTV